MDEIEKTEKTELEFDEEITYINQPLVAIVGRPNVGKSTLFNRFLRRRRAITDPTPGVTRDPIEEACFIFGKPVRLLDTGGFKLERKKGSFEAEMDELVVQKTLSRIKTANLILLLLEAGTPTAEDEELIQYLRQYSEKLVVAINKTEGGRLESDAWNYLKFGFKKVHFISAEHGDNITKLAQDLVSKLDFSNVREASEEDKIQPIRIALIGKPNTGKSTLANRLTGTENSIVTNVAGTTRDVVEGEFEYKNYKFQVLDTAGIRRKAKIKENIEYYSVNRAIKNLKNADIVIHLIEADEGLADQDKKIIAHASSNGIGVIFVLNKWDQLEKTESSFREAEKNIKIMFAHMEYAPVRPLSALTGKGVPELLNTVISVYKQLNYKVETSALNLALNDWIKAYPPPHISGGNFKLKYIVQKGVNPVRFLIFASKPEKVSTSYLAYIRNKIRKDLGFDKIPVILEIKGSRKRWEQRNR